MINGVLYCRACTFSWKWVWQFMSTMYVVFRISYWVSGSGSGSGSRWKMCVRVLSGGLRCRTFKTTNQTDSELLSFTSTSRSCVCDVCGRGASGTYKRGHYLKGMRHFGVAWVSVHQPESFIDQEVMMTVLLVLQARWLYFEFPVKRTVSTLTSTVF